LEYGERIVELPMEDCSRHFGALPQTVLWYKLRHHLRNLEDVTITDFVTDHVTEAWVKSTFHDYQFSINDQCGDYWLFVKDRACADDIVEAVLSHCRLLVGNERDA
jgi:beta-xylosidase